VGNSAPNGKGAKKTLGGMAEGPDKFATKRNGGGEKRIVGGGKRKTPEIEGSRAAGAWKNMHVEGKLLKECGKLKPSEGKGCS